MLFWEAFLGKGLSVGDSLYCTVYMDLEQGLEGFGWKDVGVEGLGIGHMRRGIAWREVKEWKAETHKT